MKRLVSEKRVTFDADHLTDVWMIGPPLSLSRILIHIDFDQPLRDRFDLILTLIIPNPPTVPYNLSARTTNVNILIGRKDQLLQEKCGIIQVEGNTVATVSGKVSIYEINEEDRGLY